VDPYFYKLFDVYLKQAACLSEKSRWEAIHRMAEERKYSFGAAAAPEALLPLTIQELGDASPLFRLVGPISVTDWADKWSSVSLDFPVEQIVTEFAAISDAFGGKTAIELPVAAALVAIRHKMY